MMHDRIALGGDGLEVTLDLLASERDAACRRQIPQASAELDQLIGRARVRLRCLDECIGQRIQVVARIDIRAQVDARELAVGLDRIGDRVVGSLAQCSSFLLESSPRGSRVAHSMPRPHCRLMQQLVDIGELQARIALHVLPEELADEFHSNPREE